MGGVVNAIVDAVESVVDVVGSAINTVANFIIDTVVWIGEVVVETLSQVAEWIMNFLGFHDEDIYKVDVSSVKVYDEDLLPKVRIESIIKYIKNNDAGIYEYLSNFTKTGEQQFIQYLNYGKWYYYDYLPSAQVQAVCIPLDTLNRILSNKYTTFSKIVDVRAGVPTNIEWCKHYIQNNYNYDVASDFLISDNEYYEYYSEIYNTYSNTFTIALKTVTRTIYTYLTTIVTVTPNEPEITYPDGENKPPVIIETDTVTTVTYKDLEYRRTSTGIVLKTENKVDVTTTEEIVEANTVVDSTARELFTVIETNPNITITMSAPFHESVVYYIIKFNTTDDKTYYWIQRADDTAYPELNSPVSLLNNLEMLPIATLRSYYFDLYDYNTSEKEVQGVKFYKPSTITKERLDSTNSLLKTIGLTYEKLANGYRSSPDEKYLQEAFFLFGVSPSNTHSIVSKVLYEYFNLIYYAMPYNGNTSYGLALREHPYNIGLAWSPRYITIEVGSIGSIGTYKHYIEGNSLYLKKQINSTTYRTIVLDNVSAFTVIGREAKGGGGCSLALNNPHLILPLSYSVLQKLTIMDKTTLLGQSVYLQFYTYQHTHLEWYETEAFASFLQVFVVIISIAVTALTIWWNPPAAISWWTITESLLLSIGVTVAVQLALQLVSEYVQDSGLRIALSAVVVIAGAVASYNLGLIDSTMAVMTTAIQLVDISTNAYMVQIREEQSALAKKQALLNERYEKAQNELNEIAKTQEDILSAKFLSDLYINEDPNVANNSVKSLGPSVLYTANTMCFNFDMLYDLPEREVAMYCTTAKTVQFM